MLKLLDILFLLLRGAWLVMDYHTRQFIGFLAILLGIGLIVWSLSFIIWRLLVIALGLYLINYGMNLRGTPPIMFVMNRMQRGFRPR